MIVDITPAPASRNHLLAECLQCQRSKVCRWRVAVEPSQRPQSLAEVVELAGVSAIGPAVVYLCVLPEAENKVVDVDADRTRRLLRRHEWSPARGKPFGDDAIVLGLADLGPVRPEVMVRVAQGNDGLTGGLVQTVRRNSSVEFGHEQLQVPRKNGMYRFSKSS